MAKFWFDGASTPLGAAPSWMPTPPTNVTLDALGTVVQINDRRLWPAALWGGDTPLVASADDCDVLIKWRECGINQSSSDSDRGLQVYLRQTDVDNRYTVYFGSGSVYRDMGRRKTVAGTTSGGTTYTSAAGGSFELDCVIWKYARVQVQGSVIRGKYWKGAASEPGTWAFEWTDTDLTTGALAIGYPFLSEHVTQIAYISVGTGADMADQPGSYEVSGIVTDEADAPIERDVRVVNRATGAVLGITTSDPVTGAYTVMVNSPDEVNFQALDDAAAPTRNEVIGRTTPV